MEPRKRGKLVIVIGPSAGGKTTIVEEAIKRLPSSARLVTTTTRPRRENEVDGVHYHFIDRAAFEQKLARGEFLEHNEFDGKLYGSSRIVLEDMLRKNATVFAILDVNGARKALHAFPEATSVFIRPESITDLRHRHEGRGMSPEDVAWRIDHAKQEMACAHEFDSVIMNREGRLEDAMKDFLAVVRG